jgi:hypothetical protein
MNRDVALDIARSSLLYLMEDDIRFENFCSITGLDFSSLEGGLNNPSFLECALEYCLSSDALIVEISKASCIPLEDFAHSFSILSCRDVGY